MNYYTRHIGDYITKTIHLTMSQHGVYNRLLDIYYSTEQPISQDFDFVCKTMPTRSDEEKSDVSYVLKLFFVLLADGWHNQRCDNEIKSFYANKKKNTNNGKLGGRPRKEITQTKPKHNPSETQSKATNNPNETELEPNDKANPNPNETLPSPVSHSPFPISQSPLPNESKEISPIGDTKKPEKVLKRDLSALRPDVIKYADYVYLTAIEYARMSDKYTKEVVDKAIELLSLWKSTEENKNKCHMDDNLTIQKWAIKEAMKNITEEKRLAKAQGTLPFNKPTGKTLNQLMEEQDALAKTV